MFLRWRREGSEDEASQTVRRGDRMEDGRWKMANGKWQMMADGAEGYFGLLSALLGLPYFRLKEALDQGWKTRY